MEKQRSKQAQKQGKGENTKTGNLEKQKARKNWKPEKQTGKETEKHRNKKSKKQRKKQRNWKTGKQQKNEKQRNRPARKSREAKKQRKTKKTGKQVSREPEIQAKKNNIYRNKKYFWKKMFNSVLDSGTRQQDLREMSPLSWVVTFCFRPPDWETLLVKFIGSLHFKLTPQSWVKRLLDWQPAGQRKMWFQWGQGIRQSSPFNAL